MCQEFNVHCLASCILGKRIYREVTQGQKDYSTFPNIVSKPVRERQSVPLPGLSNSIEPLPLAATPTTVALWGGPRSNHVLSPKTGFKLSCLPNAESDSGEQGLGSCQEGYLGCV